MSLHNKSIIGPDVSSIPMKNNAASENTPAENIVILVVDANPIIEIITIRTKYRLGRLI
jgi:hypothetical protein